jgi:hypothetical protein
MVLLESGFDFLLSSQAVTIAPRNLNPSFAIMNSRLDVHMPMLVDQPQ